jgi:hypothetical protein
MCVSPDFVLLGGTDFVTAGQVDVLDVDGAVLASVSTGIAPGKIVMQPTLTAIGETADDPASKREVKAEFDVLGRPCLEGAPGLRVVLFTDGTSEMRYKLVD